MYIYIYVYIYIYAHIYIHIYMYKYTYAFFHNIRPNTSLGTPEGSLSSVVRNAQCLSIGKAPTILMHQSFFRLQPIIF